MRPNNIEPRRIYYLRPDVQFHQPATLLGEARSIDFGATDLVLSCPSIRARSKVIGKRVHQLLLYFRDGASITSAIIALSKEVGEEAGALLRNYLPILQDIYQWGYLCSESELARLAPAGEGLPAALPGFTTQRVLKQTSAIVVVQAISTHGETVCIKRLTGEVNAWERAKILNEAEMLLRLQGLSVPRLIQFFPESPECGLVSSWVGAMSSWDAFAGALGAGIVVEARLALRLALAIIRVFEEIGNRGVLHSDIHHNNVRFSEAGRCSLIDFGLAFLEDSPVAAEPLPEAAPHFLAPEQVPETDGPYRRPTRRSEQYSLAALLYFLLSGEHYLDFRLEASEMIAQIQEELPRPLILRNGEILPDVERVLARALAKDPDKRYHSLSKFGEDFERALAALEQFYVLRRRARNALSNRWSCLDLLTPERAIRCKGDDFGIAGSLNNALAALALASARNQPDYLDSALIWASHARCSLRKSHTFHSELKRSAERIVPYFVGAACLHQFPLIVDLVLLAVDYSASGDLPVDDRILESIDQEIAQTERWDFTGGHAALLNALCYFERIDFPDQRLHQCGERLFQLVFQRLSANSLPNSSLPQLGMAHGTAGAWYAALQWMLITNGEISANVDDAFGRFCDHLPIDQAIERSRSGAPEISSVSWWCNGLSGILGLLSLAVPLRGHERRRHLIQSLGVVIVSLSPTVNHLCCGKAGQALALVQAYRITGETAFLEAARTALMRAAKPDGGAASDASILKGELGIALVSEAAHRADSFYVPFLGEF
jgi:serine/threonine protein kinase